MLTANAHVGEFAVTAPDIEHVTFKSRAVEPKTVAANTSPAFLSTRLWNEKAQSRRKIASLAGNLL
jgi:hypothetical protein